MGCVWTGAGRAEGYGHVDTHRSIKCLSTRGLNKELIKSQCSHLMDAMLPLKLERILMAWENVHSVT